MTASALLDGLVPGVTYRAVVVERPRGTFQYDIALLGALGPAIRERAAAGGHKLPEDFSVWEQVAAFDGPACTDQQAADTVLEWLARVAGVGPGAVDCVLHLPTGHRRVTGRAGTTG